MLYKSVGLPKMPAGFNVFFYVDRRDRKPVEDFIDAQPAADQVAILRTLCLLRAMGISMGMPHTKKLRGSDVLWELRCDRNKRNFRVFYHPMGQSDYPGRPLDCRGSPERFHCAQVCRVR
jgi:hypothetical protein